MGFEKFSKKELINLVETLLERVNVLEKGVETLNLKVAELQEENQILKVRKNSSNSSMSPSADMFKSNQSLRVKSDRKKGGQPGHTGHTLEMSSTPDEIIYHTPFFCKNCGINLENLPELSIERRQVIDIPPIIPIYTEHQSVTKICSCGCVCKADFPTHINSPIQYGSSIESLSAYFSTRQYLPFGRMKECFLDIFGLKICESSIANSITRFAKKGQFAYQKIKDRVLKSEVIGSDETGAVVNGEKGWYWVWQTPLNTFISFSKSRGFDAVKAMFSGNANPRTIVSDCWAAQLKVNAKNHQICTAHLMRELNYFIESSEEQWAINFKNLLADALKLKPKIIDYDIPNIERQLIQNRLNKLLHLENYSKIGKLKAFQKRLQKHNEKILPFLFSAKIPADNNASERAIRNVKVKQKTSGQFVSEQKAIDFAIIRSIIDTAIKNNANILHCLKLISQITPE